MSGHSLHAVCVCVCVCVCASGIITSKPFIVTVSRLCHKVAVI